MEKLQKTINYQEFADIDELSKEDKKLVLLAQKSTQYSYSPYSGFKVGAALLLENGKVITGSNQENAAFPVSLCAERVALFSAHQQYPDIPVHSIAITAVSKRKTINDPVTPCGSCRQAISESEFRFKNPIRLILSGETGKILVFESIKELLPFSFTGNDL